MTGPGVAIHDMKAKRVSFPYSLTHTHTCKYIDVSLALCSSRHLQAHITVRNALNLSGGGWFDKLDPYAIVRCSSQQSKTQEFAMQVSTQVIRLTPTLINNVLSPSQIYELGYLVLQTLELLIRSPARFRGNKQELSFLVWTRL